ncbi:MAG: methionyl-tRNA formyltransferase [Bacteroidetes bacterium]|nr:methionyl-tRNA formyltransferase [Bacteroidota bacterium]MBS1930464.1 methionyl-tRNA formyltransferase [Bacteroidota bacterium]
MGTPEFAVASLEALVNAKCDIVAVVTAPDKLAGRGMKMTESPVKKYAVRHHLKVLQPEKFKNPDFLKELKSLNADLQIVVAFRMLPEIVWNMPPMGTINVHASLLPQYRGAAPINWAIINGEKETGITTFRLQHEIDTGNVLLQEKIEIRENETAGELHDRLKDLGAQVLLKTVHGLSEGSLQETPQPALLSTESIVLKNAPKIFTKTCGIDWNKPAHEIYNLIRGLSPYPGAFAELGDKTIKIFSAEKEMILPTSRIGHWESDKKTYLKFACADGYILLKDVQLEGKKRMLIEDFLRGYRF